MPKNTYFSQDEYERRWKAVYDSMAEKGYETAVIWGKSAGNYERHGDLLYLTNYYSNLSGHSLDVEGHQQARSYGAVILHRGQEPELIMDMPSFDMDQPRRRQCRGPHRPHFRRHRDPQEARRRGPHRPYRHRLPAHEVRKTDGGTNPRH